MRLPPCYMALYHLGDDKHPSYSPVRLKKGFGRDVLTALTRSCPIAWCRSDGSRRAELPDQAGTAESLTLAVSLTALMASRVM
jgi:hypothetical protein